tara:strand:- start:290 stop:463 length:174 start_codon:yes stop_codon:yes gene_type:complete
MFKSLLKAASVVVDLPVAIIADVVTCGGVTTDQAESYTSKATGRFVGNVSDAADPDK